MQGTGITAALRILEMADAFGLPVALVNSPARYAAHVGTVLPNHLMMEVIDAGPDAVLTTDDRHRGRIDRPRARHPGSGSPSTRRRWHGMPSSGHPRKTLNRRYRRAPDSGVSEPGLAGGAAERPAIG